MALKSGDSYPIIKLIECFSLFFFFFVSGGVFNLRFSFFCFVFFFFNLIFIFSITLFSIKVLSIYNVVLVSGV